MRAILPAILLALLPAVPGVSSPAATPVLRDGFDDGGFTNGADPLDAFWLVSREDTPRLELADGAPGNGGTLRVVSAKNWTKVAAPLGAPFGLHGTGTFARLSFTFRLATPAVLEQARGKAGQDMFRFGLFHANGAVSAPRWSGRDGEADGFGACLPFSPPGDTGHGGANLFHEDNQLPGKHGVLGGPAPESLVSLARSPAWPGITDDRPHRVVLLLREEPGERAALSLSIDDRVVAEARDVALRGRPRAFDFIAFGTGSIAYDFELDDVLFEVVPD